MPYDADLRCSYFRLELNMSWFYESMREAELEFDFLPAEICPYFPFDTERQAIDYTIKQFECHIEKAFNDWVKYKIFNFNNSSRDFDIYCDVWEFLRDVAIDYSNENSSVVLVEKDEEEEEEEDEQSESGEGEQGEEGEEEDEQNQSGEGESE